jgi:2-desacetyl-2-hydroxyethyl bacteriochlorophyllide A dehydrogenase
VRALVVAEPGRWSVEDVPDPEPGPGEILLATRAVGICGSDLHILAGEFPPTPYPIIPGHEFAGVVAATGPGGGTLRPGDRVAVDPSLFCGSCRYCRAGRGNLCTNWGAIGDTVNGAFAEFVVVPERNAYVLPPSVTYSAGALVEPMSCVVHGLQRLAVRAGSEVLIVGGGTIGIALLQAARSAGAVRVDVVDSDPSRLARAKALGAGVVDTSVAALLAARGNGYEYVIEATGVPAAARDAVTALDRGGTLLVFGVAPQDGRVEISPFQVYNDELTIMGTMAVLNSFAPALGLVSAGAIDSDAMVTHTFPLDDFDAALDAMKSRQGLKVQIHFD